jgi:signal transduction histidine kinase
MKQLKLLILIFSLVLSIPLAFFVLRSYQGLEQEEAATLRYFAETFFDEMEQSLAALVQREEGRAIDEYNYHLSSSERSKDISGKSRSPLSDPPPETFIIGYFQNNPDGSFQTPVVEHNKPVASDRRELVSQLQDANLIFNRKRVSATDDIKPAPPKVLSQISKQQSDGLADKYLDTSKSQEPRAHLGQKKKRIEKITPGQAMNIAKQEMPESQRRILAEEEKADTRVGSAGKGIPMAASPLASKEQVSLSADRDDVQPATPAEAASKVDESESFQVEVAPLQSVFIDDDQIFIFRRIMINNQIYRQGFVLKTSAFLNHLAANYFAPQPMAAYTGLQLRIMKQGQETSELQAGLAPQNPEFVLHRTFPSPFSFLDATLTCDQIPRSAGRRTLTMMIVVFAVVISIGLFAIYQSARTIVDLSERRSQFVSSVTHELKTPLTNIRMYIEMLEQGIAKDPEREQEYFRIVDSEGARLSRLINNVLELSKLEKQQRHIDLQPGTFEDVAAEVEFVMRQKLHQEGFILKFEVYEGRSFNYDREVMIQVLINLIENSMKFGKTAEKREIIVSIRARQSNDGVEIRVSDTGPGIPRSALKKVFNDFYRVDNSLTRTTRGTGIGLALVKKFVALMGGTVAAENNKGPGCTITISLPG